jgi:hypothetical protein
MRFVVNRILTASLCAVALQAPSRGQSVAGTSIEHPKSAAGPYQISGVVVDSKSGSPLHGVDMVITPLGAERNGVAKTTAEDGTFVFDKLPAGKYRVVASRRGYVTSAYQEHQGFSTAIVTGPGLETTHLRFPIVPAAILSGSVIDDEGDPVSGAMVTLFRQNPPNGSDSIMRAQTTTTDDDGAFEFTRLASGTFFIAASARPWYAFHPQQRRPGDPAQPNQEPLRSPLDVAYPTTFYADTTDSSAATPIALRAGDHPQVTLALHPVPAVQLRLKIPEPPADSNGAPVRGFAPPSLSQTAFGKTEIMIPTTSTMVASGDQRYFEISGLAQGEYTLEFHGENGQTRGTSDINLSADQVLDNSPLAAGAEVKGVIAMAFGARAPEDLSVSLASANGRIRTGGQKISDHGAFAFHDVAPGLYELFVTGGGRQLPVLQIRTMGRAIEGGRIQIGTDAVTLQADVAIGSATITGFAERNGQRLGGAMIVLVPQNPGPNPNLFRRDQSDSDGSFTLQRVVPGRYNLIAIEDGWELEWAREAALQKYLPHGQLVEVREATIKVDLPDPVAVQAP